MVHDFGRIVHFGLEAQTDFSPGPTKIFPFLPFLGQISADISIKIWPKGYVSKYGHIIYRWIITRET